VSLELPPASSLSQGRAKPKKRRLKRFFVLALLASIAALAIAAALAAQSIGKPILESLEPSIGEPGGEVRLSGRNFGKTRGEGRVDVDGMVPTSGSYLSWSDTEIRLKLPPSFDSGLLHVVTRKGVSKAKLYMNRSRLPVLASDIIANGGGPRITSISPEEGCVGSLVVLAGSGFGESRGESEVQFAWSAESEGDFLTGDLPSPQSVSSPESDLGYESWSDKEIRLRVPDGAASGSVYVVAGGQKSKAAFFRVSPLGGRKSYTSRISYSFSQSVSINKVKASGPSELYLWLPLPAESSSQRLQKLLGREPEPMMESYRGTSLYRFAGLSTGVDKAVRQSFLVQAFSVETSFDAETPPARPQDPPALMAAYTAADPLVPSDASAIKSLAAKITGGEKGSLRSARLVWDWLGKNLAWTERGARERPLDALAAKRADSYSYAIICAALLRASGLPALPVAGYLVDPSLKAVRHYWVEVYLYGLGWLPLDPVLGSGASPGGLAAAWDERSRYFGGLDDRHIAFTRGYVSLAPMSPTGRRVSKDRRWSFQSFYEEAVGGLSAYSSYWGDIEVSGAY
jgi:hypothetical protein